MLWWFVRVGPVSLREVTLSITIGRYSFHCPSCLINTRIVSVIHKLLVMADVRYCVEYAKSGRSGCKKCKQKIEKGMGRIGKITPNPFSDDGGEMKVWYHMRCMFETLKVNKRPFCVCYFTFTLPPIEADPSLLPSLPHSEQEQPPRRLKHQLMLMASPR